MEYLLTPHGIPQCSGLLLHAHPYHLLPRAQGKLRSQLHRDNQIGLKFAINFDGVLLELAQSVGNAGGESGSRQQLVELDLYVAIGG